jgi:hypothetical protein
MSPTPETEPLADLSPKPLRTKLLPVLDVVNRYGLKEPEVEVAAAVPLKLTTTSALRPREMQPRTNTEKICLLNICLS